MVLRHFWLDLVARAWRERSVVWLAGVRRVGKTYLCQSLPDIEYFDCELPRVRRMMADPENFLDGLRGRSIVLDEIHRLPNPSEMLKIAADHYPRTRVLATGSVCIDLAYRGLNAIHRAGLSRLARERVHHPFSGVYWYFDTGGCARAAPTPRPTIPIRTSGSSSSETRVMLRATGSRASARSMRGTPPRSCGARPGGSGVGEHVLDDLLQIRQPSRALG